MARPIKNGIDYFPLDVDIFSDEKMVPISVEFGIKGEIIVVRLLCAIYRNSYFIEWTELMRYRLAKEMPSVSGDLLDSVVLRLVKWGFFDKDMFETYNVLTSKGIQSRYFSAVRKRGRRNIGKSPYLLIDIKEAQDTNEQPQQPKPQQPKPKPPTPAPKQPRKKQTPIVPKAPTPPTPPVVQHDPVCGAADNQKCLERFFAASQEESLRLLCKNIGLGPDGIETLRKEADAIINAWNLSSHRHDGYTDWSRHLISTLRIRLKHSDKKTIVRVAENTDYTFDGGFGGQDV